MGRAQGPASRLASGQTALSSPMRISVNIPLPAAEGPLAWWSSFEAHLRRAGPRFVRRSGWNSSRAAFIEHGATIVQKPSPAPGDGHLQSAVDDSSGPGYSSLSYPQAPARSTPSRSTGRSPRASPRDLNDTAISTAIIAIGPQLEPERGSREGRRDTRAGPISCAATAVQDGAGLFLQPAHFPPRSVCHFLPARKGGQEALPTGRARRRSRGSERVRFAAHARDAMTTESA